MSRRQARGRNTPPRYGWVLKLPSQLTAKLSEEADRGHYILRDLAFHAEARRQGALTGRMPDLVTMETIAAEEGLSPQEVRALMKRARQELFGADLSDSAIYHRLRREKEIAARVDPECEEPGCTRTLPARATARRRYCDHHASGHARIRRYRERRAR